MKINRPSRESLAQFPAALLPLLPTATCPACLGAYAGLVSALGIGFLFKAGVLIPLIIVFLSVGIASAVLSFRKHRHIAPLTATLMGTGAVLAGRLVWNMPSLLYAGVVLLAAASLWNALLNRRRSVLVQLPSSAIVSNARR